MPKHRHLLLLWLAGINSAPSRKCSVCFFFLLAPHAQKFTLHLVPLPLKTTCAGTPAFQLVADVISARNIRSLSCFPHFNYNTTWRTDLLLSEGLEIKKRATLALASAKRHEVRRDSCSSQTIKVESVPSLCRCCCCRDTACRRITV